MNKNLKIALIALGIVVLIIAFYFISTLMIPKYVEEIDYAEYQELINEDKDLYFFVGSEENKTRLEEIAKDADLKIYYLESSSLTDDEKEGIYEGSDKLIYRKDGEVYATYDGDFQNYQFMDTLISWGAIPRQIVDITVADYLQIIEEDKYSFMFIGSATCSYCTMFEPELEALLEDYDVDIYYLDLSTTTSDEREELFATDSYFEEEQWGTPLSFLYKDGERIDVLSGYQQEEDVVDFLEENNAI